MNIHKEASSCLMSLHTVSCHMTASSTLERGNNRLMYLKLGLAKPFFLHEPDWPPGGDLGMGSFSILSQAKKPLIPRLVT